MATQCFHRRASAAVGFDGARRRGLASARAMGALAVLCASLRCPLRCAYAACGVGTPSCGASRHDAVELEPSRLGHRGHSSIGRLRVGQRYPHFSFIPCHHFTEPHLPSTPADHARARSGIGRLAHCAPIAPPHVVSLHPAFGLDPVVGLRVERLAQDSDHCTEDSRVGRWCLVEFDLRARSDDRQAVLFPEHDVVTDLRPASEVSADPRCGGVAPDCQSVHRAFGRVVALLETCGPCGALGAFPHRPRRECTAPCRRFPSRRQSSPVAWCVVVLADGRDPAGAVAADGDSSSGFRASELAPCTVARALPSRCVGGSYSGRCEAGLLDVLRDEAECPGMTADHRQAGLPVSMVRSALGRLFFRLLRRCRRPCPAPPLKPPAPDPTVYPRSPSSSASRPVGITARSGRRPALEIGAPEAHRVRLEPDYPADQTHAPRHQRPLTHDSVREGRESMSCRSRSIRRSLRGPLCRPLPRLARASTRAARGGSVGAHCCLQIPELPTPLRDARRTARAHRGVLRRICPARSGRGGSPALLVGVGQRRRLLARTRQSPALVSRGRRASIHTERTSGPAVIVDQRGFRFNKVIPDRALLPISRC